MIGFIAPILNVWNASTTGLRSNFKAFILGDIHGSNATDLQWWSHPVRAGYQTQWKAMNDPQFEPKSRGLNFSSCFQDVGLCRCYWHFIGKILTTDICSMFFLWENQSHIIPLVYPFGIIINGSKVTWVDRQLFMNFSHVPVQAGYSMFCFLVFTIT